VIGNGTYASAPALKNPPNDARDMAATLTALGFEVSSGINVSQRDMKRLIREFGQKLKGGGSGLFYYAGHGVQAKGRNYLIPIDAEIQSEAEVEDSGVDVGLVLNYMDEAQNGLNIVILDACRNNPFGRSFRSAAEGLAQVDAPTGTLIAYATAPGRVASDGTGQNGLYTSELLKQMRVPSVSVTDMFMRVRAEVMKQTGNKQVPWESSSLVGAFYFGGNSTTSNTLSGSDKNSTPPPVNPTTIELSFWDSIKNSTSAEDFNAYLRKYPNGEFAELARIRAANLSKDSSDKPQPPKGDRGGIGVQFEVRDNRSLIKTVDPNGPSGRAGLKPGDQILKVNGQGIANLKSEQIAPLIRGPVGTQVTLTIQTADAPARDVVLTRVWSAGLAASQYAEAGLELQKKELWAEAEAQYREALKLDNDTAWVHGELGYSLNRQNKNPEAESEYRKALLLEPKSSRYHMLLAWIIYSRSDVNGDVRQFTEAEAEAQEAVRLDGKDAWSHNMLGLVFLAQKKWTEAEAEFSQAIQLDAKTAQFKDNLVKAQKHKRS
jgi:Flp pilus assembly protein TadD